MSDIPISDSDPSPGQQPAPEPQESAPSEGPGGGEEVSRTLAALEQKLRDLEDELRTMDNIVEEHSEEAPGSESAAGQPAAQTPAAPEAGPPHGAARLIDESLLGQAEPAKPTPSPPRSASAAAEPSAERQAMAAEISRFRGHLRRLTQELCEEYDGLLERLGLPIEPPGAQPPGAPLAPPPAESQEHAADEELFAGHVELGVGPFFEIASLSAFERDLARLSNVTATAVRRFEASHAVIDLELCAPTALVSELKSILAAPLRVRQIAGNRLSLTFDDA